MVFFLLLYWNFEIRANAEWKMGTAIYMNFPLHKIPFHVMFQLCIGVQILQSRMCVAVGWPGQI